MRTALTLLVLLLPLTLCFAADVPTRDVASMPIPNEQIFSPGRALLQLSPMYVEIRDALADSDTRENQLLVDLAAAEDEATAEAIVAQLEILPIDRALCVLRIQARYARLENRVDLERKIRLRMLALVDVGAL